jgi:uncharacterized DUF497 family protein
MSVPAEQPADSAPRAPSVPIDPALPLPALLAEQSRCWRGSQAFRVEDLLARHISLADDREALLQLVYHEVLLRERRGERPSIEEYVGRFPNLADALREQFAIHKAIGDAIQPTDAGGEGPDCSAAGEASSSGTYPFFDPDHSDEEDRFITIGTSLDGRLIILSHTDRGEKIRIISARLATRKERKLYEEGE